MSVTTTFVVVLILLRSISANVEERAVEGATLFFKKFLNMFIDVVHELETRVSELREEVRFLKEICSELAITVNDVQSQVTSNAGALEDLETSGSTDYWIVRDLQANVLENSFNIQNLEIMNSQLDNKILNLTIAHLQNRMGVLNLQPNASASTNEIETSKPKTCLEIRIQNRYAESGVYDIFPSPGQIGGIKVYCDLETKGGGWTVLQSRSDKGPRVDFYRGWQDYEQGFGTPGNEFWIGLQNLATLTASGDQELRIEITDRENQSRIANYPDFRVGDETEKFELQIGKYIGDAGDSFEDHNGSAFTTKDQDNDKFYINCAIDYRGAWWYNSGCGLSNLNGDSTRNGTDQGIWWYYWHGDKYSLKTVQMKIRSRNILQM